MARHNRTMLISAGLIGVLGAALIAPGRARLLAEQLDYELLDRLDGGIVVRRYKARLAAETAMHGGVTDPAFRRLASFIFGGNRNLEGEPQKINMTLPVEVGPAGIGVPQTMRFFLPAQFSTKTLPVPIDPTVRVVERPAETLAVKRFTGSGAGRAAEHRRAELLDALADSCWAVEGDPSMLFYDAPWVPLPLRRSEVVVRVNRR